jgi:hypothetical protein
VLCQGCHGSTHAEWPVANAAANDNVAATTLQGHDGVLVECAACHAAGELPLTLGGPHGMHNVGDALTAVPLWIAFSYARQDYPDYALDFVPGSAAATSLNREMEQGFINLIWSPFATVRDGVFSSGWLDIGIEYLYSHRELFGGSMAAGAAGDGDGDASRVLVGGVVRF